MILQRRLVDLYPVDLTVITIVEPSKNRCDKSDELTELPRPPSWSGCWPAAPAINVMGRLILSWRSQTNLYDIQRTDLASCTWRLHRHRQILSLVGDAAMSSTRAMVTVYAGQCWQYFVAVLSRQSKYFVNQLVLWRRCYRGYATKINMND